MAHFVSVILDTTAQNRAFIRHFGGYKNKTVFMMR
jgi:hypothetical protein